MQITRTSLLSGKTHTLDIPCTQAQLDAWNGGTHIQDALPNLSADDREFVLSGITPEEWAEVFGTEEDA